jgi:hypothetical protein
MPCSASMNSGCHWTLAGRLEEGVGPESGAAPGPTGRTTPVQPTGAGTRRTTDSAISVFARPGLHSGMAFGDLTFCGLRLCSVQPTSTGAEMPGRFTKHTRFVRQVPSRNLEKVYQNGPRPLEIGRHEGKGRTVPGARGEGGWVKQTGRESDSSLLIGANPQSGRRYGGPVTGPRSSATETT